ncbi:MAG TPA: hypothetical protein VGE02_05245, partial [Gemmatimonadales bacterium]
MQHRRSPALTALTALAVAALSMAALFGPAALGAQVISSPADECYGFAFGRWDPPLDMRAAGHHVPSPDDLAHAPGGRDWAAAVSSGRDTTLLLFPAWWPAGVAIRFPAGVRTPTDTVRGRATALVANGLVRNPEAAVLAWPVPCGSSAPDRSSGRVLPPRADPAADSAAV